MEPETDVTAERLAEVEALLFASDTPLPLDRLAEALLVEPTEARAAVEALRRACEAPGRGLALVDVAGGVRLVTRPELAPALLRLQRLRLKSRLSRAAVETLAIVAYRQPITKPDVDALRGQDSGVPLRHLVRLGLVHVSDVSANAGAAHYATTPRFLELFHLPALDDLPRTADFERL